LVTANGTAYGVLDLTLNPDSFDFKFGPAAGQPDFSDSGSQDCH
jgi:hypothetical protein